MKKGISLIVLVITILVMIIIAGAIIISLSNQAVIENADLSVIKSDLANAKYVAAVSYSDITIANNDEDLYNDYDADTALAKYVHDLRNAGYNAGDCAATEEEELTITEGDDVTSTVDKGYTFAKAISNKNADHIVVTVDPTTLVATLEYVTSKGVTHQ